jgi:hypothetical protein
MTALLGNKRQQGRSGVAETARCQLRTRATRRQTTAAAIDRVVIDSI